MEQYSDALQCYNKNKSVLEGLGYEVGQYREINCGLQFEIKKDEKRGIIRVYQGKKGVRIDLSQVRNEEILNDISIKLSAPQRTGSSDPKDSDDPVEIIGTDESGKGDYFGPLVIAGVYVDAANGDKLIKLGVDDSKKLSDKLINLLAGKIREMCPYSVVAIGNERYNELYSRVGNLNRMLAWGHARAIENLLSIVECKDALSDQFGDPSLIENALMEKGKNINLRQRPRAEENVAVAAASILARDEFVKRMEDMSKKYGIDFPKGASSGVLETARVFTQKYGMDELKKVAKLHFKTTLTI